MTLEKIVELIDGLTEQLAEIEHKQWSHWQAYVHEVSVRQEDGSMLIPANLVSHWERQIATSYPKLSEKEKNSDREQAMMIIDLLKEKFCNLTI